MTERPDRPEDLSRPRNEEAVRAQVIGVIDKMPDVAEELKSELRKHSDAFMDLHLNRAAHPFGTRIGSLYYGIRNEHLKMATALGPMATAVAQYFAAKDASAWPLVASALIGVVVIGMNLKNYGAELEPQDFKVLMTLRQIQPASCEELSSAINGLKIVGHDVVSDSMVLAILKKLQATRLRDGSVEAFVAQTEDQRWSVNGL